MALALFYLKYAKLLPTSFTPTFYENHVLINLHDKLSAERKDKYIKKGEGISAGVGSKHSNNKSMYRLATYYFWF